MNPLDTPPGGKTRLWTEARLQRLIGLWNERLSTAQIARALGPDYSRSAVVGKLFRLGLRRTDEQRYEAQAAGARRVHAKAWPATESKRPGPPTFPASPLPLPTACAVEPRLLDLLELCRSHCRWPYGVEDRVRFCGQASRPGSSYCADHHAIAYFATLPPLTLEALESTLPPSRNGSWEGSVR